MVLAVQEDGAPKAKPPPPDLPPLHIANVLRHPSVEFFGVPRLGAYVAVPFDYVCKTHANAIPPPEDAKAEEPVEGDEGKAAEGEWACGTLK